MAGKVKTRFCPSPTGYLHVGGARTALFNWLYARHCGGAFLLRIEDTDRARHVEGADQRIVEDLRWLGIDWDEGFGLGGDSGPYVQSQRLEIYADQVDKLIAAGAAYYAFESEQELEAGRAAAAAAKGAFHYPRPAKPCTDADYAAAQRKAGKSVVVRFAIPGRDVTIQDVVFGPTTVPAGEQDDFVIVKDDGYPTYHLANVIDDGLMGVTFIMRGQEFLGQSWRQALLREALGFADVQYAHLPLIMDMAGQKLSKRDGAVAVDAFRAEGYLSEALLNFLALLGWSAGGDREKFTLAEMVAEFTPERLSKTNAKFDRQKLLAFNTEAIAAASPARLLAGFQDYLRMNRTAIPAGDEKLLARLIVASAGFRTFADIVSKCGALYEPDDAYAFDPKAVEKVLVRGDGYAVLAKLRPLLAGADWTEEGLKAAIDGFAASAGLGMGKVAQPLRVAVAGKPVSPAIYETLLLLGKDKTLARIDRCLREQDKNER